VNSLFAPNAPLSCIHNSGAIPMIEGMPNKKRPQNSVSGITKSEDPELINAIKIATPVMPTATANSDRMINSKK
jgi:hypothetical protein